MHTIDYVRSITALRREVERGEILPDLQARLAVRISEDATESLIYFFEQQPPNFDPERLGWDLRRLFPEDGFDLFALAVAVFGNPRDSALRNRDGTAQTYLESAWASFDRQRDTADRLMIDEMDDARASEWPAPPEIAAAIEGLTDLADRARADRDAAAERAWQIAAAADYAADIAAEQQKANQVSQLPAGTPGPGGMPLLSGQAVIVDLGAPILEGFNAGRASMPCPDAPALPDVMAPHPLYTAANLAIGHLVAMAQSPVAFRASTVADVLGVLAAVHADTLAAAVARLRGLGVVLPEGKLSIAAKRFETAVARELRQVRGYVNRIDGTPEPMDAQNLAVFLRLVGVETRHNAWKQRAELRWSEGEWTPVTDAELNHLRAMASGEEHRFRPSKEWFRDMLMDNARQHGFDPVIDRIDSCQAKWDGVPRIATWLSRVCGVPCDLYHQAVGKNLVGGIVRRARHPGSKHDETVILIGPQGCGKSTLCRILALNDEWFSDSVTFDGTPQNTVPMLFGRLVVELGELAAMQRREIEFVKRFLVAQSDSVTLKYQAFTDDFARRCVFIGSTNAGNPLNDVTGNRRFLPVNIAAGFELDLVWLRENVDQIVGEAAHLEAAGATFDIPREVWGDAAEHQEAARSESPLEVQLAAWLDTKPADIFITAADLQHGLTLAKLNPNDKTLPALMRRFGFERHKVRVRDLGQARVWVRSTTAAYHPECARAAPYQSLPGRPVEMRLQSIRI
jgi:hypothetical protein